MSITFRGIAPRLQPPLDCAEIEDLLGHYFHNRVILKNAKLEGAKFNPHTRLPNSITQRQHDSMVFIEGYEDLPMAVLLKNVKNTICESGKWVLV